MSVTASKITEILNILKIATASLTRPMSERIVEDYGRDPFLVLISCLLSLRARDTMTYPVSRKLFEYAKTPAELVKLDRITLEKILRPIGFYRRKAQIIQEVAQYLLEHHAGQVPATEAALRAIPGVGPKTAALVLSEGFGVPAICVDVHVHRIANRLGWVQTKTPEETEDELKKLIPSTRWREVNSLLVMLGQNICTPRSPRCSSCPIAPYCPRIGVTQSR